MTPPPSSNALRVITVSNRYDTNGFRQNRQDNDDTVESFANMGRKRRGASHE